MQFENDTSTGQSSTAVHGEPSSPSVSATTPELRIADCTAEVAKREPKSRYRNLKSVTASPLKVMFIQTDMRIGGAEMLTANIIRRLDRNRFAPELCCLKERGTLGEMLAEEIPVHYGLLQSKFDLRIWPQLTRLLRRQGIDAVVTVGAGDKMFWGRLAARRVGVPVVLSALHSTGWPDGVGRLNRLLTPLTDSFIAVAASHGEFLAQNLGVSQSKVAVIPNGVDTQRFAPFADEVAIRRSARDRRHRSGRRHRRRASPREEP